MAEASYRAACEVGGAADNGRGGSGLRAQVAVACNRRGAVDGFAEFALLASKVRACARRRWRRANLYGHGRHGRGVVSGRPHGHGGGERGL